MSQPRKDIIADDQAGREGGLAVGHDTDLGVTSDLLDLAIVDLEDVLLALGALLEREVGNLLGGLDKLSRWLLDGGESLVEGGEGRVTEGVGAGDVGRDVLVWLLEVWEEGFA